MLGLFRVFLFFFFNDTATTEIYTLSLHDALPICIDTGAEIGNGIVEGQAAAVGVIARGGGTDGDYGRLLVHLVRSERSEEHTSELQSQSNLVCRLLLEKRKATCPYPLDPDSSSLQ